MKWKRCKTEKCQGIVAVKNILGLCNTCYKGYYKANLYEVEPSSVKQRNKTLSKYKMNEVEYERMFKSQNFMCAICKQGNKSIKRFCVDHCHETGRVRGILCNACNKAIGLLKDSKESLKAAIDYLDQSKSDQTNTSIHSYGKLKK